jgi:hypothetical protein
VVTNMQSNIDFYFPVQSHQQLNAVFSSLLRLSVEQVQGVLDTQTPLYNQINDGGMQPKTLETKTRG